MSRFEDEPGDILKKVRFGRSLTAAQAAKLGGISAETLESLESLQLAFDPSHLALAEGLGLNGEALLMLAADEGLDVVLPTDVAAVRSPWSSWTYVWFGPAGAVVIDPAVPYRALERHLGGNPLAAVFVTHSHQDHLATYEMVAPHAAACYAHPDLAATLGARPLAPGEQAAGLRALAAPGHAEDGLVLYGDGVAFTGDALFARSAGRARTAADFRDVLESVRRILALPPATVLLPGHGPPTTVALERRLNAFYLI
ncbi:MAG: MBL fold metallo-hydrolase [Sulfobacillus sp.]